MGLFFCQPQVLCKTPQALWTCKGKGGIKSQTDTLNFTERLEMNDSKAKRQKKPQRGKAYHQSVEQRIFRLPQVMGMYGLSKATVYRKMKAGLFPQSVSIGGGRARGWRKNDLLTWESGLEE